VRRIALILPSFAGGGAERVALTLLARLDPARAAAEVGVLDAAGPLADTVPAHVAVRDLARPRLRDAAGAIVRWLRASRPDVVLSTFGYVNLALLALRPLLPATTRVFVREANTPSLALAHAPAPALTALAYRLLYPTADRVICLHRAMAEEMTARFGVDARRVALLANPVEEARLRAASPVRAPGPGRRFVAAGRLARQKGFDRLIRLFGSLPGEDRLTILGTGPDAAALAALAESLGLADRVALPGFVAEPAGWFAGADAVLVASRWEGMPNVALEALACGTHVIATPESGGIGELAAEAPDGAVTVAAFGAPFLAAMAAVRPAAAAAPRPSLLPARYEVEAAVRAFASLVGAG